MRATLPHGAEVDEARLVGMEREPEPAKALFQHFHDPLSVVVVLERHHKVVGKPNKGTGSRHAGLHLALEPLVQHMMQENVRQHRRDDTALRGSFGRQLQKAVFQDPCFQPLVDHPPDNAVGHSLVENCTELLRAESNRNTCVL